SSILTSFNAWICEVCLCSPKGLPLTAMISSPSTMPQEVFSAAVNFSQRISSSLFCCGLRPALPGAGDRALQPQILAQRLAGIILVEQFAALQLRHDVLDEIRIGARHDRCCDDKAVAAAFDEHFFEPVGDLLR